MTNLQKLQLQASEIRQKLSTLATVEGALDDTQRNKIAIRHLKPQKHCPALPHHLHRILSIIGPSTVTPPHPTPHPKTISTPTQYVSAIPRGGVFGGVCGGLFP